MNSPLKFPRRVRIHGGECGAVARALHHEAQKVALTQNEQMFSSDVKGLMRQADRKKSLRSTLIERKQMSTKTSIKRIALVAVSALGFGLLSVAPSSGLTGASQAATVGPVRVSFTDGTRDAVSAAAFSFTNNSGATLAAAGLGDMTLTVTQAPTTSAEVTVTITGGGTAVDTLGGNGTQISNSATVLGADVANGATIPATIAVTAAAVSGTYKGTLTLNDAVDDLTITWSFTTTGKVATLSPSATEVSMPAINDAAGSFVISKSLTLTLKDASGATTQAATGDTVSYAITGSGTNISFAVGGTASGTLSNANLVDGSEAITVGSDSATADSETITFTPNGVMPAQGVVAATVTATTLAIGSTTAADSSMTTPSISSVAVTVSGTPASYNTDPAVASFVVPVTGLVAGTAYVINALTNDAGNTVKDDADNTTAVSMVSGTDVTFYGIVPASGKVTLTFTGALADTKYYKVDGDGDANYNEASDTVITAADPAYDITITSPVVTPTLQVSATAITVAGKVSDQYGNPLPGTTVAVTAVTDDANDTNPTASTATLADGTYSVTLPAVSAATTSATIGIVTTKTGITVADVTAGAGISPTINFSATGSPVTITYTTTTGDATGAAANVPTTYPAIHVLYEGSHAGAGDVTNATYTISGATVAGLTASEDFFTALTPTTTPGAQVVVTGSTGLKFSTSNATAELSALKDTVTVASGTAVYVFATLVGVQTVTLTSGATVQTVKVVAYTNEAGARNISAVASTKTMRPSAFDTVTINVTDAFGNPILSGSSVALSFKSSGGVSLEGPRITNSTSATDESGQVVMGVLAGGISGTGTITVTATGDQFGAAAGAATSTTAGTNGLTASTKTATITVTVDGATENAYDAALEAIDAATAAEEAAFEAIAAADAATLAAEEAKASADAATTAIEELSSQVATLMAALQAQITTLANTVAKILKRLPKK
jgi:hypothetical protein